MAGDLTSDIADQQFCKILGKLLCMSVELDPYCVAPTLNRFTRQLKVPAASTSFLCEVGAAAFLYATTDTSNPTHVQKQLAKYLAHKTCA